MSQTIAALIPAAVDYERTLVLAIEVSNKSWVLAAQVPGLPHTKAKRTIDPQAEALLAAVSGYRARAAATGCRIERVIAVYEAGWSGFWLARWLMRHGVEVYVVQPSSVPVDRRLHRAKSDGIDSELLLRTLLAWLRGEPRVCSMVPVPDEADEDARRCVRERTELISERIGLTNRIGAILATLGVSDYNPLLRSRGRRLVELRTALGEPLPANAHAKIKRLLARLELVLTQIAELERERDAVVETEASDKAGKMIQQLTALRGIGVQSATVLVREAFVRFPRCSSFLLYGQLLTCLEMARDVRVLRSASSGTETTKPAPSLSMPMAQPATMVPIPDKEVPKKEENEAKSEVELAKVEAQTAKASEALAQRKLADIEAALKKAKEEAQRASAEVERAKAEAQNARESEAAVKDKLADAEAARVKAEQACHIGDTTRPGLGGRLRRWLGRTPNP